MKHFLGGVNHIRGKLLIFEIYMLRRGQERCHRQTRRGGHQHQHHHHHTTKKV